VVVIAFALLAVDAYFWHSQYTRTAVETAQGLGSDFNYQVARHLQPLHR
jgi:hypothetical protein